EIHEYRSLAYSTGGNAIRSRTSEGKNRFYGFIGCQSDKTNEAIDVLMGLITDMPRKEDRVPVLAKYLQQSVVTSYLEFKAVAEQVTTYKEEGYSVDPNQEAYAAYSDLSKDDIVSFYDRHISGKPIVISIYGDLKKIDKKALEKYGKLTEMKINEVVNF
ncbi:MAG: zinc protease, partial [Cyclobacteriaceae bacterium]